MSRTKLLIVHFRHNRYKEYLERAEPRLEITSFDFRDPIPFETHDAEILIGWKLQDGLLECLPRLRWISAAAAGVDNIIKALPHDSEIVVNAELPGMTQDDIEINLKDSRLTLQGEKKHEKKEENENYHSIERSYGKFSRSLRLPAGVDAENVQATFRDGVLKITMPKTEEAKPKKISISAGS